MGCAKPPCGKIIHGAAGIAKAMLGMDQVPATVLLKRRDECRNCEHATRSVTKIDRPTKGLTIRSICRKCDCLIAAKTALGKEACPIGKWSAFRIV